MRPAGTAAKCRHFFSREAFFSKAEDVTPKRPSGFKGLNINGMAVSRR
jgi:hypothetical protein